MVMQTVFPTKKVSKHTRIPMRTIRALADQIARKFDPDEIILFGSNAYGKPNASSDVDLLVVMETPKGEFKTIMEISESLPRLPFRVDIIARSREVINRRKNAGDFFLREITKKGKVLYARSH
jgi:predicted nucleotidyltransferase